MNIKESFLSAYDTIARKVNPKGKARVQPAMSFGSIDINTGAMRDGYIANNGTMQYSKSNEEESESSVWDEPEYVRSVRWQRNYVETGLFCKSSTFSTYENRALYKQHNKFTNKNRYWMGTPSNRSYIDTSAYEKSGHVVELDPEE